MYQRSFGWSVTVALAILAGCGETRPVAPALPPPAPVNGKATLSDDEWRARLTPLAYAVLREKQTELAFTGRYDKHYEPGLYRCAGCNNVLFSSKQKFDSRTGWPSFTGAAAPESIYTHSTDREEVLCARCDGHLGHVFPDGPPPGGLRYCINSAALRFEAAN